MSSIRRIYARENLIPSLQASQRLDDPTPIRYKLERALESRATCSLLDMLNELKLERVRGVRRRAKIILLPERVRRHAGDEVPNVLNGHEVDSDQVFGLDSTEAEAPVSQPPTL